MTDNILKPMDLLKEVRIRQPHDQDSAEFVLKLSGLGEQILGLHEQIFALAANYIE